MILSYSKIVTSVVLELRTQTVVGVVGDVVIKKSNLSVYGLLLKGHMFDLLQSRKVISSLDIAEISGHTVVVNDVENISELNETIRIKEAVNHGYVGIGQLVVTKSGKRLGHVFDFMVETPSLRITNFYVKKIFSERIISPSTILKYESRKITVKDDFEPIGIGVSSPDIEVA